MNLVLPALVHRGVVCFTGRAESVVRPWRSPRPPSARASSRGSLGWFGWCVNIRAPYDEGMPFPAEAVSEWIAYQQVCTYCGQVDTCNAMRAADTLRCGRAANCCRPGKSHPPCASKHSNSQQVVLVVVVRTGRLSSPRPHRSARQAGLRATFRDEAKKKNLVGSPERTPFLVFPETVQDHEAFPRERVERGRREGTILPV